MLFPFSLLIQDQGNVSPHALFAAIGRARAPILWTVP
jgi:hypothetical protein